MKTGNLVVDKLGEINFSGNIIPQNWYLTIKRETGKPYLTAIVILSDIVYWYRPTEIRDEGTGQVIAYKKKFSGDKLQRSYQQIADMFGISKKEATNAVVFLEKMGVIQREFRTISINGIVANNVLYIDLIPDKLKEITYPESFRDRCLKTNVDNPNKEGIPLPQKSDRGTQKNREVTAKSGETNTEISPKTLTEILPKENKERKKATSYDEILSAVEDDSLRELYLEYIKMRKLIKSPMTDRALTMLINKVNELEPTDIERQKRLLETAIMNNWKSVYPLKDNNTGGINNGSDNGNIKEAECPTWGGKWLE